MAHDRYQSPLNTRYASEAMQKIFSDDNKFSTWRRLWLALAKSEQALGLPITEEQIEQMQAHLDDIDYEKARAYEVKFRHDVMAHVHTFGDAAPLAKGIIHWGATSCFVGDNGDLLIYHQALLQIQKLLINLMKNLRDFADTYKALPTLGFTHFQPAQLTTVGKRAALWLYDLVLDYEELEFVLHHYRLRGVKGTTGTQASFLELFDGDYAKVNELNRLVVKEMGFEDTFLLTGQTYSRKFDARIMNLLSSIAQSLHKFATDMRLLQSMKEMEEPFEKTQIGSSAMAYKRNPMRCERICSLARYAIVESLNAPLTQSVQWFERTLDDSANKRISIPESFMAVDAILTLAINVTGKIVVNENVIHNNIMKELPFMTTENILMHAVKKGGDRQVLHEKIRVYSMEAAKNVKEKGEANNLLDLIAEDETFDLSREDIAKILDPRLYTGAAEKQVEMLLEDVVDPLLQSHEALLGVDAEISV